MKKLVKDFASIYAVSLMGGLFFSGCRFDDSNLNDVRTDVKSILIIAKGLKNTKENLKPSRREISAPQTSAINPESNICWAIFLSQKGFPSDPNQVVKQGCIEVKGNLETIRIEGLPEAADGYAIALFQDMNKNGILDTRKMLGMDVPDEPFGLSNNPSLLGVPTYQKCKILPKDGEKFIIQMKTI